MPFVVILIGLLVFVSAIKGTSKDLGNLIVGDFVGQGSFLYWLVAILVIGAVGYIKPLKPLANSFLLLLVVVLFLSNKGFFSQITRSLRTIANGGVDKDALGKIGAQ